MNRSHIWCHSSRSPGGPLEALPLMEKGTAPCREKGAPVMSPRLGIKACVWAIVGLLAAGTARAQEGDGSIVGWGVQVVGVDLSADFVRGPQSRPEG